VPGRVRPRRRAVERERGMPAARTRRRKVAGSVPAPARAGVCPRAGIVVAARAGGGDPRRLGTAAVKIERVFGWEALDSRGNPTVGCEVAVAGGATGVAIVPAG